MREYRQIQYFLNFVFDDCFFKDRIFLKKFKSVFMKIKILLNPQEASPVLY